MNEGKSQPWYKLYAAAIVELDCKQLVERMDATEAAIHSRLLDLQHDGDHHEERQMMGDAQRTLEFLRRQAALRHPEDWDGREQTPSVTKREGGTPWQSQVPFANRSLSIEGFCAEGTGVEEREG